MKKFLVFLVSLVVVVCAGLTTYYFMRNNEIITIKTKEIYCNAGDTIPLASLGIDIKKANVSKKTTFDYNAGGEDVEKYIKYDDASASFVVSNTNAGDVTLVIRSSNKKYNDFTINVHIGNGSSKYPYYIFNEADLMKIGSVYRLDKNYILMNNINLTSSFQPIGYNSNTQTWSSFNGTFDGQNHTIKGLNLKDCESANAGFFSTLGETAVVKNLTLTEANISGYYSNAGVLAGVSNGRIEKVAVLNSSITSSKDGSYVGSLVGKQATNPVRLSYADTVALNVTSDIGYVSKTTMGGLMGEISLATIQACYTNEVEINTNFSTVIAGGFAGNFEINPTVGTIQQSYANTTCTHDKFGAFLGKITKANGFDMTKANMLRYLIGNFAVVYGKENSSKIADADLVKSYDKTLFTNPSGKSVFSSIDDSLYLVRAYAGIDDVVNTNEFVYYAIDSTSKTLWDTTYVWNVENNGLPVLKMGSVYPADPESEYFIKDMEQTEVKDEKTFEEIFNQDIKDMSFKLTENVDLTAGWTPIAFTNSIFDGNGKTIKINLNTAKGDLLGLFSTIDNSTIKNLNIVVTGVSANAKNAGALAGRIISNDTMSVSSVQNVTVTFEGNFKTPVITNFGGIAGTIINTTIKSCKVVDLKINSSSSITTAGAIVGFVQKNGTINSCKVQNSVIYASSMVGGIAGQNKGSILNPMGDVSVGFNKTTDGATIGGIVGTNDNYIAGSTNVSANVHVENFGANTNVGAIAGVNNGSIKNFTIFGKGVEITSSSTEKIYVGGAAATNNGTISGANVFVHNVGTYRAGLNHYVGGVATVNNGTIEKTIVQSNVNGNWVAGIVVEMGHSNASVDQVIVGHKSNGKLTKNTLKGDKYVAGAVVNFKAGKMTNLQLKSKLQGEANSTKSSLIALIFPYGTTLKAVTVDSAFEGYGDRYRETWIDFASYNNKAEFGLTNGETGDSRFNVYKYDNHHGIMQSVVINTDNAGVSGAKAAMGQAFAWGKDYQDTEDSSFIKTVKGFNDVTQFQGKFEFVCSISTVLNIKHKATKTLNFEIGTTWKSKDGIYLSIFDQMIGAAG